MIQNLFLFCLIFSSYCFLDVQSGDPTRDNLCDESKDVVKREDAFQCSVMAMINGSPDIRRVIDACDYKLKITTDRVGVLKRLCEEHKKGGGPISSCMARILNPAKANPSDVKKLTDGLPFTCFKDL